jgi:carboxymethylenebutenolidase
MAIKTEWVTVVNAEQTFPAYLALPSGPARGGVVVVQEIFGVNSHIRSVAERTAEAGYVALAPDLFWRIKPHLELGYTPDDVTTGRGYRGQLKDDETVKDVEASMKVLTARPEMQGKKWGVMGFCFGGMITYLSAARLKPTAASSYYGGGIVNYLAEAGNIKCPIMFHFGELDHGIPVEQVDKLKDALKSKPDATVHTYPGADHGFHCDARGSYNPDSAKQAWGRTVEFFNKTLG